MRQFLVMALVAAVVVGLIATALRSPAAVPSDETRSLLQTFVGEFVEITPGKGKFPASFEMGSDAEEDEQPVHQVTLRAPFSIARYEVPQNLYEAVTGKNPSRWPGPRNSAEVMTWNEAVVFCRKITEQLQAAELIGADEVIRLPSEAEWEYCCRAGTTTAYSFGDSATAEGDEGNQTSLLDEYGWHTGNAAGNDPPVGALKPNPWGLYDMHGYLSEFCADHWQASYTGAPADGSAWRSTSAAMRIVIRGGSWKDHYSDLRSASRQSFPATARDDAVGFRCVRAKAR